MRQTMNRPLAQPTDDKIGKAIGVSVALHVIAVAAFTIKTVFYPSEPLVLEETIRVDIVSLPDKSMQKLPPMPVTEPVAPQPPAPPAPEPVKPAEPEAPKPVEAKPEAPKPVEVAKPKPEPAKPAPVQPDSPKVNLNKAKQDQAAALKRLEALQKIEQMMKSDQAKAAASKPQPVKGNQVSNGASLRGIARMEHQNYLRTVDGAVKGNWALPGWMRSSNLSAKVRLFVDAQGNIVKKTVTRSSNNEVFDERALAAIEAASPLPAPPESLAGVLAVDGIELEFVPE